MPINSARRLGLGVVDVQLRDYQTRMVEEIQRAWQHGHRRVLGVLPTGGGKTEVAVALISAMASPTSRVLVVVERKVLCSQWWLRLRRRGIDHVGLIQGENSRGLSAAVLVATVQSLRARGMPENVSLVVIDESHIWHAMHDRVMAEAGSAFALGLTATPLREGLGLRFDVAVMGATMGDLIQRGDLVKPRYFAPATGSILDALGELPVRSGDYSLPLLSKLMRGKSIVGDVVGEWQRRASERSTIAFAVDKQHAQELVVQFLAVGVAARVLLDDTDDDERAGILLGFERGEINLICSVGVLSIGFDSPLASCVIMARPTLSTSLYIQQGGRVLRPFPGKADALVLDHAGNVEMHGRLEDFIPSTTLSVSQFQHSKQTRSRRATVWTCASCQAIVLSAESVCCECGAARERNSSVLALDGELREVGCSQARGQLSPTCADVQQFFAMARWHAEALGLPVGWAYFATLRRFKLSKNEARALLPPPWSPPRPIPPDEAAARWFRADFQRMCVIRRKVAKTAKAAG